MGAIADGCDRNRSDEWFSGACSVTCVQRRLFSDDCSVTTIAD
jgi:hypothetical protein